MKSILIFSKSVDIYIDNRYGFNIDITNIPPAEPQFVIQREELSDDFKMSSKFRRLRRPVLNVDPLLPVKFSLSKTEFSARMISR